MAHIGIIGGSGLDSLEGLHITRTQSIDTPYGIPAAPLTYGNFHGHNIVFMPRHGKQHNIPPHLINYRANLWALKAAGVNALIAISAVGGITSAMHPGQLVIPNQIIDYTHGRAHTFFEQDFDYSKHIDFTHPYDSDLRNRLLQVAAQLNISAIDGAVYGVTQGPRLESAAEIKRLERDGCDIVGMTGMPEAALARELAIPYACCAIVANWAAGQSPCDITIEEIMATLEGSMTKTRQMLSQFLAALE